MGCTPSTQPLEPVDCMEGTELLLRSYESRLTFVGDKITDLLLFNAKHKM